MFIPRSRGAEAARRICVSSLSEIWSQISRLSTFSLSFTLLRSLSCSCYITNSDFGYFPHSPSHPSSSKTYASPFTLCSTTPHTSLGFRATLSHNVFKLSPTRICPTCPSFLHRGCFLHPSLHRFGRYQRRHSDHCHWQKVLEDNQRQGRGRLATISRSRPY